MTSPGVAALSRLVLSAEAAVDELLDAYPALPEEMPNADGSAFLLTYLPARMLWSAAVTAWLHEDDGQPIRITREELRKERRDRRRRERAAAGVRARAAGAERARASAAAPALYAPR